MKPLVTTGPNASEPPWVSRGRPTILGRIGRWMLIASGLLVAFVAYQQWGTALGHWQGQRDLRTRFDRSLAQAHGLRQGSGRSTEAEPAIGDPVGELVIPRIGLDQVIVEGVQATQLSVAPGHYPGTALPGQRGNAGIAGHRTTHGAPFNGLADLRPGDAIVVTTLQGRSNYRVTRSLVVSPDDRSVLAPTAAPRLTLTTCTPKYSAAQRLIVIARLVTPAAPTTTPRPGGTSNQLAGPEQAGSPETWLRLAGCCLALSGLAVSVGMVRRRTASSRLFRMAPWFALVVGTVLLYVAFGVLDTLLPASF